MSHHLEGLHPGPELSIIRPAGTPNVVDADVFPPLRSQAPDPSIFLPYMAEDISFEDEYEEYMKGLGWSDDTSNEGPLLAGPTAWQRNFAADIADGISDSESIVSIGDLGDDTRLDPSRDDSDVADENLNNWEVCSVPSSKTHANLCFKHMSPKTMAALPKSPATRRSSSGTGLRPVLPFGLDDGSAVELDDDDDIPEMGPAPRENSAPFASGAGVDEVEYAYG